MKYFTSLWFCGANSEDQVIQIRDSYWAYIEKISEQLPFPLRILAKHINLHDAVVVQFSYNPKEKTIFLQDFGGDLQVGYFSLECTYFGVSKYWDSRGKNRDLIHMEILSDEIELLDKETFSQKILFSERNEIEIVFNNIAISVSTITEKEYLQLLRFE